MIKFFRKIRQRLLTENKFSKYLIYAFGEILLVMIGILLALQVNNWNERRKQQNTEVDILNDIIIGLTRDKYTLDYNFSKHNKARISCEIILKAIDQNENYTDTLAYHFARVHNYTNFYSNRAAYESLKTLGFKIISNKDLRLSIVNLYEQWYAIHQTNVNILSDDIQNIKRTFNKDHFDKFKIFNNDDNPTTAYYEGEMVPNDFNQLKLSKQYKYYIKSLLSSHKNINWMSDKHKSTIDTIIKYSKKEIERLKN